MAERKALSLAKDYIADSGNAALYFTAVKSLLTVMEQKP